MHKRWKITFREEEEPIVELQVNASKGFLVAPEDGWETLLCTDDVAVELIEPEVRY